MYESPSEKNKVLGWDEIGQETFEPHFQDFGDHIGYISSCSLLVESFKILIFRLDVVYGGVFFLNTHKVSL